MVNKVIYIFVCMLICLFSYISVVDSKTSGSSGSGFKGGSSGSYGGSSRSYSNSSYSGSSSSSGGFKSTPNTSYSTIPSGSRSDSVRTTSPSNTGYGMPITKRPVQNFNTTPQSPTIINTPSSGGGLGLTDYLMLYWIFGNHNSQSQPSVSNNKSSETVTSSASYDTAIKPSKVQDNSWSELTWFIIIVFVGGVIIIAIIYFFVKDKY